MSPSMPASSASSASICGSSFAMSRGALWRRRRRSLSRFFAALSSAPSSTTKSSSSSSSGPPGAGGAKLTVSATGCSTSASTTPRGRSATARSSATSFGSFAASTRFCAQASGSSSTCASAWSASPTASAASFNFDSEFASPKTSTGNALAARYLSVGVVPACVLYTAATSTMSGVAASSSRPTRELVCRASRATRSSCVPFTSAGHLASAQWLSTWNVFTRASNSSASPDRAIFRRTARRCAHASSDRAAPRPWTTWTAQPPSVAVKVCVPCASGSGFSGSSKKAPASPKRTTRDPSATVAELSTTPLNTSRPAALTASASTSPPVGAPGRSGNWTVRTRFDAASAQPKGRSAPGSTSPSGRAPW
mmetsp:Transcript_5776/g.19054  ORF Transcript_5776/g.19054 Transcript_5776/m.19054 type:complete len:366 (+) Transcript_5776:145-1242(+)